MILITPHLTESARPVGSFSAAHGYGRMRHEQVNNGPNHQLGHSTRGILVYRSSVVNYIFRFGSAPSRTPKVDELREPFFLFFCFFDVCRILLLFFYPAGTIVHLVRSSYTYALFHLFFTKYTFAGFGWVDSVGHLVYFNAKVPGAACILFQRPKKKE